jgi:phage terminase large subunit
MEWPKDYMGELARRARVEKLCRDNPNILAAANQMYAASAVTFINDCVWVFEPRAANKKEPTKIPVVPFPRQTEFIEWMVERFETNTSAPVEKSRDSGATWMACAFAVWIWLYKPGSTVGFGSRKETYVDQFGSMDSIFEKIRSIIRNLPAYLVPEGFNPKVHSNHMRLTNPANGASIVGEAGDNIGRGGRTSVYFVDEAAFIERPALVAASLTANTDCRIDISSPRVGTLFNASLATNQHKFIFDLSDAPWHTPTWIATKKADLEAVGLGHVFRQEYLRDATAGIEGQLIPGEWVEACVNACEKLGITASGERVGGLDVADGGIDASAFAHRHGVEVKNVISRGDLLADAAGTWAYGESMLLGLDRLLYDSIGVGAGAAASLRIALARKDEVKEEIRQRVERIAAYGKRRSLRPGALVQPDIAVVAQDGTYKLVFRWRWSGTVVKLSPRARHEIAIKGWSGAGAVVDKAKKFEGNRTNEDMFSNAKAQAWWSLRQRFMVTWRAVMEGVNADFDSDKMISLSSAIKEIRELKSELSQVTYKHNEAGKIVINKAPDGHKSPNRADAVVIAFAPISRGIRVVGTI